MGDVLLHDHAPEVSLVLFLVRVAAGYDVPELVGLAKAWLTLLRKAAFDVASLEGISS